MLLNNTKVIAVGMVFVLDPKKNRFANWRPSEIVIKDLQYSENNQLHFKSDQLDDPDSWYSVHLLRDFYIHRVAKPLKMASMIRILGVHNQASNHFHNYLDKHCN